MNLPRSHIPEMTWPAIPDRDASVLLALQFQLEQSQRWPLETLRRLQFRQLQVLLRHAHETVPYYRERIDPAMLAPDQPLTSERWLRLPLLSRHDLQANAADLLSRKLPQQHGKSVRRKTSGSTGQSMTVTDTEADQLYWMAITLRDHLWHRRDLRGGFVSIRSGRSAADPHSVRDRPSWGPATGKVYPTGPATVFYHRLPIERQAELLLDRQPKYLLLYPSNALRLAEYFRTQQLRLPSLREVITYGELLLPEVRDVCRQTWGVGVADMYSCEETGYIALQCPESDHYHCQAESLLVEVLRDDGTACLPGEIGRVVLTPLHNFAMPLIRYENLDYAEVGDACPCGRGLPVLKRILGRRRNMAVGLDGQRFWPEVGADTWSAIEGIDDVQLMQGAVDHMDVRVVSGQTLTAIQERALAFALRDALGQDYAFSFHAQAEITRQANGKYERFICHVADA